MTVSELTYTPKSDLKTGSLKSIWIGLALSQLPLDERDFRCLDSRGCLLTGDAR